MAVQIKGVDISYCQQGISYDALKAAGVKFAIIRAGCAEKKDNLMDEHVKGCRKLGIAIGFYWYSYATTVEGAKREAQKCVEVIKGLNPEYPVYFDMEDKTQINGLTKRVRTDMAIAFCDTVKAAGFTAGIYANPSWFETYYYKKELTKGDYEIWLAHWTESPNKPSSYNYGQKMHQWGLDKINGQGIDGDISYFDYAAGKTVPAPKPTTPTKPTGSIEFNVGDVVKFKGGYHYASSTSTKAVGGKRTAGKAKVTAVARNAAHSLHLVGEKGGSDVYGWVDAADVEEVSAPKPATIADLKVGMVVRFKGGSHYVSSTATKAVGGTRSAGTAKITNLAKGARHPVSLVGEKGGSNVYGWVDIADIELI